MWPTSPVDDCTNLSDKAPDRGVLVFAETEEVRLMSARPNQCMSRRQRKGIRERSGHLIAR